ncbi:MAG: extracellular solute-binding protein [Nocardioidaceae bacterium]
MLALGVDGGRAGVAQEARATPSDAAGPIKVWLLEQPGGDRLGQGDGRRRGTPRTPTRRSPPRRSRPARPPRRSSGRRSPRATRPAWSSTPHRPPCRSSRSRAAWSPSTASTAAPTYVESRTGDAAEQYKSPDGKYYQIPWKSNPVMIFYNKDIMKKAGIDPENPPLATYDEFLATSQHDRRQRRGRGRDLAGADERVLPVLVRLLPALRRRDRRQAARSRTARRRSTPRPARRSQTSGRRCTPRVSPRRRRPTATRSRDEKAAMSVVGPWAIAVYGEHGRTGASRRSRPRPG